MKNIINILKFIGDKVPIYKPEIMDETINLPFDTSQRDFNLKKQGTHITYHKNGNIKSKKNYKNDVKDGLEINYYINGNIENYYTYKNNIRNGPFKLYYNSLDKVWVEGQYENGLLQGDIKEYFINGNLNVHEIYKNGDRLRTVYKKKDNG